MTASEPLDLEIAKPLTLPCGLELPNRVAKAALAESWAGKDWLPSHDLIKTYGAWGRGGWGMVLTGNVQVDVTYLGQPQDTAVNDRLPEEQLVASWREWAGSCSDSGTPFIMQLNHPGRQSPMGSGTRSYFAKSIAPSAIGIRMNDSLLSRYTTALMFGTPREMTTSEIELAIEQFAQGARLASEAGFAGVEIHAAHGYLLAQFLSAKSNQRTDAYGGTAKKRARIVVDVIEAIRKVVPAKFCIGIKLNSVDHQSEQELGECIEQLDDITSAGVDFVEVSGGTYEDAQMLQRGPDMQAPKSERTKAREAFFLDFARAIRQRFRHVPLMVTGGFRSRRGMEEAVRNGDCDLIGVGRPSILDSAWPISTLFNAAVEDDEAYMKAQSFTVPWIYQKLVGRTFAAGTETLWFVRQMRYILKT